MKFAASLILTFIIQAVFTAMPAMADKAEPIYWMKLKAATKQERTKIVNQGVDIEITKKDYVISYGSAKQVERMRAQGLLIQSYQYDVSKMDFPSEDSKFHNYTELSQELKDLADKNSDIVELSSIGKSLEGRELWHLILTQKQKVATQKPAIAFLGSHHAREHVSTEMPLMLAQHLVAQYRAGNAEIVNYLNTKEIHIIPMVNPDGAEFDISTGQYQMWRKNRHNNGDGTFGVDLNRNYGFGWGTGGSSKETDSDIYMGTAPFSEPETLAVKNFVDSHPNISILLSFHTFSELILYPWGGKYDPIGEEKDLKVHQVMAQTMAKWNGYTPEQASDLYIASGDTTDWAYGTHRIISFTFELDPAGMYEGGFYPGQDRIPVVFEKNIKPCLFLISYADNPYRVLESHSEQYGLRTELLK